MSLQGTIESIQKYFEKWHKDKYSNLHQDQTAINDQIRSEFRNADITNKNEINAHIGSIESKVDTNTNNISSVQQQLRPASYGNLTNTNYITTTDKNNFHVYADGDQRGFVLPALQNSYNGFLTPKEKADIYYYGQWFELTGAQIGRQTTVTNYMRMWINLGLRLVYFHFSYPNCNWLKNKKEVFFYPTSISDEVFIQVAPIRTVWAPTNVNNVRIGVTSDAGFYIRSNVTITQSISINGSLMWFYRDSPVSSKIGLYYD